MEPALSDHTGRADELATRKKRLFEGLATVILLTSTAVPTTSSVLTDAQYTNIMGWCDSNSFQEWGKRPQTLVILHMIGYPQIVDGFVS